jgi:hypothetical protein
MRKTKKGRLIAMLAATALMSSPALAATHDSLAALQAAPPEQAQAYQQALQQGPAALIAFLQTFPTSSLVPQVMKALADQVGAETAIQAALDAGVPTETVFTVAAEIAPGVFIPTGQFQPTDNVNQTLTGPY